jgi:hypothetical protein
VHHRAEELARPGREPLMRHGRVSAPVATYLPIVRLKD